MTSAARSTTTILRLAVGATVLVVGAQSQAEAASASTTMSVTATVVNNCTISTTALAFGTYDTLTGAALDAAGNVRITCTQGASASIDLNTGSNASGSTRRMKDAGTNYLTYEIYTDSGRTTVWGSGGSALTPAAAPSNAPRDFPAYGRVSGSQSVPAGNYSDTITATVNF